MAIVAIVAMALYRSTAILQVRHVDSPSCGRGRKMRQDDRFCRTALGFHRGSLHAFLVATGYCLLRPSNSRERRRGLPKQSLMSTRLDLEEPAKPVGTVLIQQRSG